jgi:hypothetical protein
MYAAVICRITNVRKHPNADRLNLATAQGNQVVIGLDIEENDLGIFFPCDGQLSDQFCLANDLYPRLDDQGRRVGGGFFDPKNRRVRAQGFRGEKSEGFWCPISYLNGLLPRGTVDNLKEGDQFTELNGVPICNKYETEATKQAAAKAQKSSPSKKHPLFKEHVDTKQLAYEIGKIPVGSVLHLSEKLHGTSGRYGYFQEEVALTGWGKWLNAIAIFLWTLIGVKNISLTDTKMFTGSRRVQLKSVISGTSFYGDEGFRFAVAEKLKGNMRVGEMIYGELVGYSKGSTLIMGRVANDAIADKEFTRRWGTHTEYKYSCPVGTSKFYVYRITQSDDAGNTVELTVPQVKARCKVLGLEYVPEFYGPFVHTNADVLSSLVEGFLDGPSTLDQSHIREGVVVRVDAPDGSTYFLKQKSFEFRVLEGIVKDTGAIDLEECS